MALPLIPGLSPSVFPCGGRTRVEFIEGTGHVLVGPHFLSDLSGQPVSQPLGFDDSKVPSGPLSRTQSCHPRSLPNSNTHLVSSYSAKPDSESHRIVLPSASQPSFIFVHTPWTRVMRSRVFSCCPRPSLVAVCSSLAGSEICFGAHACEQASLVRCHTPSPYHCICLDPHHNPRE